MSKGSPRLIILLGCCLLALVLSGCGAPAPDAATPPPPVREGPVTKADGHLADAARKLFAPYQKPLSQLAAESRLNMTYTIPGDLINAMALEGEKLGVEPENGRYHFTVTLSSQNSYQSSGLEVQEALDEKRAALTPDPMEEAPMDSQQMGDFNISGGGDFKRVRVYDAAADLSEGTAEMTSFLNGETTGHELFSFSKQGDRLYFVDAARDMASDMDGTAMGSSYLVAAGFLSPRQVETVEFTVQDASLIPSAASLDWNALTTGNILLSSLSLKDGKITTTP